MTPSRYWLVKTPEGEIADTVCRILRSCTRDGIEVVEIVPEKRDSNWMEQAIAAKYAREIAQ